MNILKIIFFSLFSLSLGFLSAQDGMKKLTGDDYSIDYLESWMLDESGKMGTTFILLSPKNSEEDQFQENINLVVQDISQFELDLESYTEANVAQLKKMFQDLKFIDQGSGDNYKTLTYQVSQGPLDLTIFQKLFVEGETAYVLTYSAEQAEFDTFKKDAKNMMNTFSISG